VAIALAGGIVTLVLVCAALGVTSRTPKGADLVSLSKAEDDRRTTIGCLSTVVAMAIIVIVSTAVIMGLKGRTLRYHFSRNVYNDQQWQNQKHRF
jgi:hypothetical protein